MDPAITEHLSKLKAKWAPHSAANKVGASPSMRELEARERRRIAADSGEVKYDKICDMIICIECGGLGTINERYNHMSITKTCPTCDGDGTRLRPGAVGARVGAGEGEESKTDAVGDDCAGGKDEEGLEIPDDLPPLEDA